MGSRELKQGSQSQEKVRRLGMLPQEEEGQGGAPLISEVKRQAAQGQGENNRNSVLPCQRSMGQELESNLT